MNPYSLNNIAVRKVFERGYRVNQDGFVVSPIGTIRKTTVNTNGYRCFSYKTNIKTTPVFVHKLCAYQKYGSLAFLCDCIRHLDGNRLNNRPENIEIGTLRENMLDIPAKLRKERAKHASRHVTKYCESCVKEIKEYYDKTKSYSLTMKEFDISSKGTLYFILNKR